MEDVHRVVYVDKWLFCVFSQLPILGGLLNLVHPHHFRLQSFKGGSDKDGIREQAEASYQDDSAIKAHLTGGLGSEILPNG